MSPPRVSTEKETPLEGSSSDLVWMVMLGQINPDQGTVERGLEI